MTTVADPRRPIVIVAMGDGANPGQAVAGDFPNRFGRLALRKPPDDLPLAALHWVFGLPVARLDCFDAQIGFHSNWLFHNNSIS